MAFNSSSQISYFVLDSLSDGSKYGLEIIDFISKKTDGNYILKKPTLYSCLTRMEKKGFVSSSYWGESELGGKRHYYTITNDGKRELEQLSTEYASITNVPVSESNADISNSVVKPTEAPAEKAIIDENKPMFLQQDNFFDITKPSQTETNNEDNDDSDTLENQIDIFSFQASLPQQPETNTVQESTEHTDEEIFESNETIVEESEKFDDGKLLDDSEKLTPMQEAQNRLIYDSSNELKRIRKRKSFSENQIEMAVVYENENEHEIQKSRIEQLKQSMLNAKQNANATIINTSFEAQKPEEEIVTYKQEASTAPIVAQPTDTDTQITTQNDKKDDAIYITDRLTATEIPIQKKISPTNIEVNIFDDNLPAPKRNANLEPTYKDMMAKLFERKKEKVQDQPAVEHVADQQPQKIENFADYVSLKNYYKSHGIEFKEYRKTNVTRHHNTNFLNFISSAILLLLSGVGSVALFGILTATNLLVPNMNFMLYILPILFGVYFIFTFIKFKVVTSKKPNLAYNAFINWTIAIFAIVIIFVGNIMCGMQFETIPAFLTSLIIPILGILLICPINYHIKKFLYKKYGK